MSDDVIRRLNNENRRLRECLKLRLPLPDYRIPVCPGCGVEMLEWDYCGFCAPALHEDGCPAGAVEQAVLADMALPPQGKV